MAVFVICVLLGLLARQAGGGLLAVKFENKKISWLSEFLFAAILGSLSASVFCAETLSLIAFAIFSVWIYLFMQTGHGDALDFSDKHDLKRKNTLTPLVRGICDKIKVGYNTPNHDRIFMAVKGFLIGLPFGGIALAVLWPLAYESRKWTAPYIGENKAHILAEFLTGAFSGISVFIFIKIIEALNA